MNTQILVPNCETVNPVILPPNRLSSSRLTPSDRRLMLLLDRWLDRRRIALGYPRREGSR